MKRERKKETRFSKINWMKRKLVVCVCVVVGGNVLRMRRIYVQRDDASRRYRGKQRLPAGFVYETAPVDITRAREKVDDVDQRGLVQLEGVSMAHGVGDGRCNDVIHTFRQTAASPTHCRSRTSPFYPATNSLSSFQPTPFCILFILYPLDPSVASNFHNDSLYILRILYFRYGEKNQRDASIASKGEFCFRMFNLLKNKHCP